MTVTRSLRPPNSLLLIMDRDRGLIPESMGGKLVVANSSCIAIGTLTAADGETTVTLSDEPVADFGIGRLAMVFRGMLDTPKRSVDIYTTELPIVLPVPVFEQSVDVEIWADDHAEPAEIRVTCGKSD